MSDINVELQEDLNITQNSDEINVELSSDLNIETASDTLNITTEDAQPINITLQEILLRETETGASTFLELTDTPSAYTGQANKVAKVNATEDAIEFGEASGGAWGEITGTLADQLDLQAALDAKVSKAGDTMTGTLIGNPVDLENLPAPTSISAEFIYLPIIGEITPTINYGSGSFVNDGSSYGFTVYPYITVNGIDYIANASGYAETTDDGGDDNTYEIELTWDPVTGADGYLIINGDNWGLKTESNGITINSLADFIIPDTSVALEKFTNYTNSGYTFSYRAYNYDQDYGYCSTEYIELETPVTDNGDNDSSMFVAITYGDNVGGFVTITDDYNGYTYNQGVSGVNNTAIDYGAGGDISILDTITAPADAVYSENNGATFGGNLKVGEIKKIKGVPYSFPDSNVAGTLSNDGAGNLAWTPETVTEADITNLQDQIDAVEESIPNVSGLLPVSGSTPMTGNLQADQGVLVSQTQQLKANDVAYTWAETIFAGAGLTNCWAMVQDDNWFYFAGSGLNSGYIFRVNKDDYSFIESTPCITVDGTLDPVYKMVITDNQRFLFYAGQDSVGKIELGSFGQVARYEHNYGIDDTQMILVDDTKVYLMVTASQGLSLIFDQETFALTLTASFTGSSTLRGGTIVGTDMYLLVSKTNSDVIKYDLTDTTLTTTDTLTLTGNNTAYGCVHDAGFLYVVHSLSPTKVSKVDLSTFTLTATLSLTSQNTGRSISTDGTYLYVTQYLSPVRITRVLISDFATFSTLTAGSGYNLSYNTLVYDGDLYTALYSTNSTFMKTSVSGFASPTYHKYGATTSNLTKIAGANGKQFACALNSTNMFFVDYVKRTVKYIEMPYAVSFMVYEAITNFVYAISTDSTSALVMILDLGTGEFVKTVTPGFTHTNALTVGSMCSTGYMMLVNPTAGEGILYDAVNNSIIDTQTGTHLEDISQLVWNNLVSNYVYGIKFDGTICRLDNDITGGYSYGTTGLANLADVALSLCEITNPILTICGKTDRRVFWWDVTGDPDFANMEEHTVDSTGTLGGAMFDVASNMILAFHQSVSNAQVIGYNRTTSTATRYTSPFVSSVSTESMTQLQVDNSGGTAIVNVLCQFGSAYQVLVASNTSTVATVAVRPYMMQNDQNKSPMLVDALSSSRFGNKASTLELIGSDVSALGVFKALYGFVASGFSSVTGFIKYLIVENIDVQGRVTVADNTKPAKAGDIRFNGTVHQGYDGTTWNDMY